MQRERGNGDTVVDVERGVLTVRDLEHDGEVLDRIPAGPDWRFEPDWDGLVVVARTGPGASRLVSERGRLFDRFFPEVMRGMHATPPGVVVRGSLVVAGTSGLDFTQVRRRLHPSPSRVATLAGRSPATLVLTDLLEHGSLDLRASPLAERRAALERVAAEISAKPASANLRRIVPGSPRVLSPQTVDRRVATRWLLDLDAAGRDGLIARHADGRRWVRVRRVRTASCVVIGFRPGGDGELRSVRLGLYDRGRLVEVGRTVAFRRAPVRRAAASALAAVTPGGIAAPTGSVWIDVVPALVCEVRYERLRGHRFRHAVSFVRWLPERDPGTCSVDQFDR